MSEPPRNATERLRTYWAFTRPFTLLPPALGMISGGITGYGAAGDNIAGGARILLNILFGALMASFLNAASNAINQVYDLEVDRINKPERMIPSGKMSEGEAKWLALALYLVSMAFALAVNLQCFAIAAAAAILTVVYSVPPFRTKRWGLAANLTIAVPRGLLLRVCGWSTAKDIRHAESWYIGAIFFLFLLGAASTKDFADMEGDEKGGCITFPIKYGVKKAAYMISPSFVLPFLLMPIGAATGLLTGNAALLSIFGAVLALWGLYVNYLILRDPAALAATENHPSWTHMYLMMMVAQLAFIIAYLV
ncbi:MAG: UbiA family prenyltransferase [Planctomycetota bacterium]